MAPPNCDIEVLDGSFVARKGVARVSPQPSIDLLFESIAQEASGRSVGIVLSGTGHDGSAGVRSIHRVGGVTLVQDPVSAAFPQMPQAALDTRVVDQVLLPEDIADALAGLIRGGSANEEPGRWLANSPMIELARLTRNHIGWELADYKDGSLGRQIQRRVDALSLDSIHDYLDVVRDRPDELAILRESMFIGVTSFYRDPDAFDLLDDLLRSAAAEKKPGETIRGWAAGAATGEEAYTLAIILSEAVRKRGGDLQVEVYATDVSDRALETARAGIYPVESVANLDPDLRQRYFIENGPTVQVVKRLRDAMVFAQHDVARDPPFLRMDVVCCRNVLIYLIPRAQKRVFKNLNAALSLGGILMLGSAESANSSGGQFVVVDEGARIYRSQISQTRRHARVMPLPRVAVEFPLAVARSARDELRDAMRDVLLDEFGPPSILVDENGAVVRQFGDLNGILRLPQGESDYDFSSLVDPQIRTEGVTVLTQCLRGADGVASHRAVLGELGESRFLHVRGRRFQPKSVSRAMVLLSFSEDELPRSSDFIADDDIDDEDPGSCAKKLEKARQHLHAVTAALESSNESLQAMNEELQSSTEELQASNEELQAANEELGATNEELATVNDALTVRTNDLTETNSMLENMQEALEFGLVLVDRHQRIVRFSPLAVRVFGLMPRDVGTQIGQAPRHVPIVDLESRVDRVIRTGKGEVTEVRLGLKSYLFQIMPYLVDGWVRGAVIALSDVSELAAARIGFQRQMEEYQSLSEAVPAVVYRASPDMLRYFYLSPSVADIFGVTPAEAVADPGVLQQQVHPGDAERLRRVRWEQVASGSRCEVDYRIVGPDGSVRYVRDVNRLVRGESGTADYRIGSIVDITDVHLALEKAERLQAHFEAIFTDNDAPMATLDTSGAFSDVNAPMLTLLGRERGQVVGEELKGFVHEDDRNLENELLEQAAANPGVGAHQLIRFVRPDGSIRYAQQRVVALSADGGGAGMQLVAVTDLTDLEFATRAARRNQQQLRGLFGNSPAPMVIIGTDGVFRECNSAFCQLVGYREEELVGRSCSEITHPDDVAEDLALIEELAEGRRVSFVLNKRFVTRSGKVVHVRKYSARVPSAEEDGEEVIAQIMVDVTGGSTTAEQVGADRDEEGQL